jgi:hypothetical protein
MGVALYSILFSFLFLPLCSPCASTIQNNLVAGRLLILLLLLCSLLQTSLILPRSSVSKLRATQRKSARKLTRCSDKNVRKGKSQGRMFMSCCWVNLSRGRVRRSNVSASSILSLGRFYSSRPPIRSLSQNL